PWPQRPSLTPSFCESWLPSFLPPNLALEYAEVNGRGCLLNVSICHRISSLAKSLAFLHRSERYRVAEVDARAVGLSKSTQRCKPDALELPCRAVGGGRQHVRQESPTETGDGRDDDVHLALGSVPESGQRANGDAVDDGRSGAGKQRDGERERPGCTDVTLAGR